MTARNALGAALACALFLISVVVSSAYASTGFGIEHFSLCTTWFRRRESRRNSVSHWKVSGDRLCHRAHG